MYGAGLFTLSFRRPPPRADPSVWVSGFMFEDHAAQSEAK
jgi:hypothetical protein